MDDKLRLAPEVLDRFRRLDTTCVSDANDKLGLARLRALPHPSAVPATVPVGGVHRPLCPLRLCKRDRRRFSGRRGARTGRGHRQRRPGLLYGLG